MRHRGVVCLLLSLAIAAGQLRAAAPSPEAPDVDALAYNAEQIREGGHQLWRSLNLNLVAVGMGMVSAVLLAGDGTRGAGSAIFIGALGVQVVSIVKQFVGVDHLRRVVPPTVPLVQLRKLLDEKATALGNQVVAWEHRITSIQATQQGATPYRVEVLFKEPVPTGHELDVSQASLQVREVYLYFVSQGRWQAVSDVTEPSPAKSERRSAPPVPDPDQTEPR